MTMIVHDSMIVIKKNMSQHVWNRKHVVGFFPPMDKKKSSGWAENSLGWLFCDGLTWKKSNRMQNLTMSENWKQQQQPMYTMSSKIKHPQKLCKY